MSLRTYIAVFTAVVSVLATPALADDANVAAVLRDNIGPDAPQRIRPWDAYAAQPWNAYARAFRPANASDWRARAQAPVGPRIDSWPAFDIRLLGHN
jgi:hypothetical protein